MSEIYITIFDYSNEACGFRWLLIKGESTINASIDIEFAFFCYDEQNKIAIYIVYKQKCSSHWLLYMFISEEWKYSRPRQITRYDWPIVHLIPQMRLKFCSINTLTVFKRKRHLVNRHLSC